MNLKNILKQIKLNESKISMILGILVVLIAGFLIFRYFREAKENLSENGASTTSTSTEESQDTDKPGVPGSVYIVKSGESLWSIAEKTYGSGYKWVDIARENKIIGQDKLNVGQSINLPEIETAGIESENNTASVKTLPATGISENNSPISGASYTVTKGDSLWEISVRAYGDGYKWVEIAKLNKLDNPNIIHPGNVLSLPR